MLQSHGVGWKTRLVLAIGVILAVVFPANALASGGGLTPIGVTVDSGEPATEETPTPGSLECTTSPETGLRECLPVTPAEFVLGVAAPPESAPPAARAPAGKTTATITPIASATRAFQSTPRDSSKPISFVGLRG